MAPITLDYPLDVRPRYGYSRPPLQSVQQRFAVHRDAYAAQLARFAEHIPRLQRIAPHHPPAGEPFWVNVWFAGLDAVALYSILAERNPRIYLEVGAGFSTLFAHRAIRDHQLRTAVISIDPAPRMDISRACDDLISVPFEQLDLDSLPALGAGDIFFFDGTHYVFSNTDTTVALLEVLPRVGAGALLHFHDVYLPWDYPPEWSGHHYAEQFVLAAYLLGGELVDVLLPNHFCGRDLELVAPLEPLWRSLRAMGAPVHGTSLWLTRR